MEPVCDQGTQVNGQIVIESVSSTLSNEAAAVLIDASKRKIQFIDKDSLVVKYPFTSVISIVNLKEILKIQHETFSTCNI